MSICFQIITASHSPNYFYAVIPQSRSNFIICLFKGCSNLFINFSIFYKEILNKALKNMTSVLPSIIFQLIPRMIVCISCGMNKFTNLKRVSQNFCTTLICPLGKTHKKFSAWNKKKNEGQNNYSFFFFFKAEKKNHISSSVKQEDFKTRLTLETYWGNL